MIENMITLNQNDLLNLRMLNERLSQNDGFIGCCKISSNLNSLNQILMSKNKKIENYFEKKYSNILQMEVQ